MGAVSREPVHKTDDSCTEGRLRVVGYVRVSTSEQHESGAGLEAQRDAIRAEAVRRNWSLVGVFEDTASGKSVADREGLACAVAAVEDGHADALVVAKLDRLSRSLMDFASLMERSRRQKWALVALDLGVDTTTPAGEMIANVMATFAQFERRLIGQRTRDALAVKRSQGVRLGRPPTLPANIRARIHKARADGMTYRAIAGLLNADVVPTAHGGKTWHASTVAKIVNA
jgi:DNA invertase Pin-like site-specific DNA recombinase